MVQEGWALAYLKYSSAYQKAEEDARINQRGLWQGAFVAPWDWRHKNNKTVILGALVIPINAQVSLLGPSATEGAPHQIVRLRAMLAATASGFIICRTSNFTPGLKWIKATASGGFAHPRKRKQRDGEERSGDRCSVVCLDTSRTASIAPSIGDLSLRAHTALSFVCYMFTEAKFVE
jgi:hypothetical protein